MIRFYTRFNNKNYEGVELLGVVIPVYNKGSYLKKCLDSICDQSLKGLEIVIVDDGSTDNSPDIINYYRDRDSRIVAVHQDNQGPIMARYNGLKKLHTKYATFVDADDWISLDTYEKLSVFMRQDIDVIESQINRYYNEKRVDCNERHNYYEKCDRYAIQNNIIPRMIWDTNRRCGCIDPSVCNKVIKREYLLDGYEKAQVLNVHYGEDLAITYPIMTKATSYIFAREGKYFHRRRPNEKETYFNNVHFFKELSELHEFLLNNLPDSENRIRCQLEEFYSYSVQMYMGKNGYSSFYTEYMFPFHLIPRDSRIILYGKGKVGEYYHRELEKTPYCKSVIWMDKNNADILIGMSREEYDYVVIAVKDSGVADEITAELKTMGIPQDKIVWGYAGEQ